VSLLKKCGVRGSKKIKAGVGKIMDKTAQRRKIRGK
jgi:hypothetical protein